MALLGIILVVVAAVAAVVGFIQLRAANKVLAAPFHKTGEVAAQPSLATPQGISFEGTVQPLEPLMAPASQRPCLYFEVEVERLWRKWEHTENGTTEKKGSTSVRKDRGGCVFAVNDGSGAVHVDTRAGVKTESGDVVQSFEQVLNMAYGDAAVGHYTFNVPQPTNSDEQTYGVRVVERLVEPQGQVFVVGKHDGQAVSSPEGTLRVSRKGRDELVGSKKKFAMVGFVAAGLCTLIGLPLAIFSGPIAVGGGNSCAALFEKNGVGVAECKGSVSSSVGNSYTWNVTKEGYYVVTVTPPAGVKYPIRPTISLVGPTGEKLDSEDSGTFDARLKPGTYKITVRDIDLVAGRAKNFKGGFSYSLALKNNTAP